MVVVRFQCYIRGWQLLLIVWEVALLNTLLNAEVCGKLEAPSTLAARADASLAQGAQLGACFTPSSPRSFISALCAQPHGMWKSPGHAALGPWRPVVWGTEDVAWGAQGEAQNTEVTGWRSRIFPFCQACLALTSNTLMLSFSAAWGRLYDTERKRRGKGRTWLQGLGVRYLLMSVNVGNTEICQLGHSPRVANQEIEPRQYISS